MTKIIDYFTGKTKEQKLSETQNEIIEILGRELEKVKRGETIALGIISINREHQIATTARNEGARHLLIAGCFYLQHDIAVAE